MGKNERKKSRIPSIRNNQYSEMKMTRTKSKREENILAGKEISSPPFIEPVCDWRQCTCNRDTKKHQHENTRRVAEEDNAIQGKE
jgi:hypothetical protein